MSEPSTHHGGEVPGLHCLNLRWTTFTLYPFVLPLLGSPSFPFLPSSKFNSFYSFICPCGLSCRVFSQRQTSRPLTSHGVICTPAGFLEEAGLVGGGDPAFSSPHFHATVLMRFSTKTLLLITSSGRCPSSSPHSHPVFS